MATEERGQVVDLFAWLEEKGRERARLDQPAAELPSAEEAARLWLRGIIGELTGGREKDHR